MITIKQILNNIKYWWTTNRDIVQSSTAGFLIGITLAIATPHLQGYLMVRVLEWREAALRSDREIMLPMHTAAPEEAQGLPDETPSSFSPVIQNLSSSETESSSSSSLSSSSSSSSQNISSASPNPNPNPNPNPSPIPLPRESSSVSPAASSAFPSASSAPSVTPSVPSSPTEAPAEAKVGVPYVRPSTSSFPAFINALYPVSSVPNWGAMHAAAEWNRSYKEMMPEDFVQIPSYDLQKLAVPFKTLVAEKNEPEVTRKLFYSTKYLGTYDLDAGEYSGHHPGVDLKLALGTPIGAIGGGRVNAVNGDGPLGLHVIIEHHIGNEVYFSIYGHLSFAAVRAGDNVTPGQFIGTVGMTGSTTGPHLHLQVDKDNGTSPHEPYQPGATTSATEAAQWTVNPIRFIQED